MARTVSFRGLQAQVRCDLFLQQVSHVCDIPATCYALLWMKSYVKYHDGQEHWLMRRSGTDTSGTVSTGRLVAGYTNAGTQEDSRVRWHRAVRNVVALNNMRPPPEPVPEEGNEEREEEPEPRPGQLGNDAYNTLLRASSHTFSSSMQDVWYHTPSIACRFDSRMWQVEAMMSRAAMAPAPSAESGDWLSCAGWISPKTDGKALLRLFTNSWMSLLLLAIPFGYAAHFAHWDSIAIFVLVGVS